VPFDLFDLLTGPYVSLAAEAGFRMCLAGGGVAGSGSVWLSDWLLGCFLLFLPIAMGGCPPVVFQVVALHP
jgi:hypothetical protein